MKSEIGIFVNFFWFRDVLLLVMRKFMLVTHDDASITSLKMVYDSMKISSLSF